MHFKFGKFRFLFRPQRVNHIPSAGGFLTCFWTPSSRVMSRPELNDQHVVDGILHDDVIEWKLFPSYWPFVRGIHRSPVISPHKGQWRGALIFFFISAWINGWVNNREAGDLRRHRTHYDVIVMKCIFLNENVWIMFLHGVWSRRCNWQYVNTGSSNCFVITKHRTIAWFHWGYSCHIKSLGRNESID